MASTIQGRDRIMKSVSVFSIVLLCAGVVGCAQTQAMSKVQTSGFLRDYSILQKGEKDQALLVYKNPTANWSSYTKVYLDPVTVWKDEQTKAVAPEDLQKLADFLEVQVNDALKQDYEMVQAPGPGVMRVSVAITEADASSPTMDTISSIVPQLRLLTGAKGLVAGGKPGFVGSASVEVKITDTQTGTLLAAAVDRRAGTKNLSGVTDKWNDVQESYIYWANKLRWRLCQFRGGKDCIEPKA